MISGLFECVTFPLEETIQITCSSGKAWNILLLWFFYFPSKRILACLYKSKFKWSLLTEIYLAEDPQRRIHDLSKQRRLSQRLKAVNIVQKALYFHYLRKLLIRVWIRFPFSYILSNCTMMYWFIVYTPTPFSKPPPYRQSFYKSKLHFLTFLRKILFHVNCWLEQRTGITIYSFLKMLINLNFAIYLMSSKISSYP